MKARSQAIKAPFPWFGGKSKVASLVWDRFGDVANYVEPFAGSLAVLLGRPHEPSIETVNDKDGFLANFWRALANDPQETARHTDWPVNEADLHARHLWLVTDGKKIVDRLKDDPEFYDCKVAGWWVWGLCQWIGSGWCPGDAGMGVHRPSQQRPHLGDAGIGVHRPSQKLPHLGNAGMGVHRPSQKLSHLGNAGRGVHRPSQQLPHLGDAGKGDIYDYFRLLSDRLRRVRVCCGDWSRVCGEAPTTRQGLTGVFLDPPYPGNADRNETLYSEEDLNVAHDAAAWAIENGENRLLRIAFCGYEGTHEFPPSWDCVEWKATGGYANQKAVRKGKENAGRERIWFSPHCLSDRGGLFSGIE